MRRLKKVFGIVLAISAFVINYSKPVSTYLGLPEKIIVHEGQLLEMNFGLPVKIDYKDDMPQLKVLTQDSGSFLGSTAIASFETSAASSTEVFYSAFGILPSNRVEIVTVNADNVILGGRAIGIILQCDGVLVVGYSEVINMDAVTVSPAKSAGLQIGDFITYVNGIQVDSALHLGHLIKVSEGKEIKVTVRRNDKSVDLKITPQIDRHDKDYHIGVWARDSSSGIGTMTYMIPSTNEFAALGHAISDADSGKILEVREGEIFASDVIEICKGAPGVPGEIKGEFILEVDRIGDIQKNCAFGLYGILSEKDTDEIGELIEIAQKNQVYEGDATLYTTIDNEGVKGYNCEISKINLNSTEYNKNFIVTITDEELLERTGGIVQGMSGSPIVQDGKLVGAITHVFVNNPACGHGIFITTMMDVSKGDD